MALKFKFFFRQKKSDFEEEENEKTRFTVHALFISNTFMSNVRRKLAINPGEQLGLFLKESTKCLKMLADKKCGFSTD